MPKRKGVSTWTWWVVGALIATLAVVAPYCPRWSDQCEEPSPQQQVSHPENNRMTALSAVHEILEPKDSSTGEAWQNDSGLTDSQDVPATAEPFDTLQAFSDPDPAVRLSGIEAATSQHDETTFGLLSAAARSDYEPDNRLSAVSVLEQMVKSSLADREQILQLLEETAVDSDPRVAELSRLVMQEQFGAPGELHQPDESEAWENDTGMTESQDLPATAEPFDTLQAFSDPDPAVRLSGIEAATNQPDENTFGLLSTAARSDYEPDNRLSAVSVLEQMVKSSLGDREQILQLLEETTADPDPRVAELSQLIMREQRAAKSQVSTGE